jgi:hypothetical protein
MNQVIEKTAPNDPVPLGSVTVGEPSPGAAEVRTVKNVLRDFVRDPRHHLLEKWNWKAALMSSVLRGAIFFSTNLVAGLHAAIGAMLAEFVLRSTTSGFYGTMTEAFASAEPPWAASATAMFLLPCMAHSVEFVVHWLRGTPELGAGIASSVVFTVLSTAFNLFAMRRGALTVGSGSRPLHEDLSRVPYLLWGFVSAGPRALVRLVWKST